jgi:hypothetical protein
MAPKSKRIRPSNDDRKFRSRFDKIATSLGTSAFLPCNGYVLHSTIFEGYQVRPSG